MDGLQMQAAEVAEVVRRQMALSLEAWCLAPVLIGSIGSLVVSGFSFDSIHWKFSKCWYYCPYSISRLAWHI